MRSETYQILLILAGVLVTALFGAFLYREIFPEYKIYQNDYIALEEFRSTYTHQPLPPFQTGVKQIVIEREDKGPPTIDRCISCHVALQIPYFSPTKIARDLNGNIMHDQEGHPLLVHNEEYIWQKLDEKIAGLRDEKVLEQLRSQGQTEEIKQRLNEAAKYESLKTAHVGDQVYDVTKVLAMHPLMGNETYPFQYHPMEEYGCTSCHNGNGRGLVTDKAHGPVFDGQYEIEDLGHTRQFTESDPQNDPPFARVFNHKPGDELIFQTEPIFVGALIQAKCIQCHQTSDIKLAEADTSVSDLALLRQERVKTLTEAYQNTKQAAVDLLKLHQMVETEGYAQTLQQLRTMENNYSLPAIELEHLASQMKYLEQAAQGQPGGDQAKAHILTKLNQDLVNLLGSETLVKELQETYQVKSSEGIDPFLAQHQDDRQAKGRLFVTAEALNFNQELMRHAQEVQQSFSETTQDKRLKASLLSDVDELTRDYQRGKELYISQACYACHRITAFSRGGVGPELTHSGDSYPWFLKRKLVCPQCDLPTSTMPNMRLDSRELEDLMTFLLAQKGNNRSMGKTSYQAAVQAWEAGRKMPLEKPIPSAQIYDLRNAMTIFATQGCAACHRLQGYESNVGFAVEKDSPSFDKLYDQQRWFRKLFPEVVHFTYYDEELPGSEIVTTIDLHAKEIDDRIVDNVRQESLLEEIDQNHPEVLESLYSPFRYAYRAKNHHYQTLIDQAKDPRIVAQLKEEWQVWKNRVHRVFMTYIQIYGLGRLIGPHLNWSGIYRTDEWLMEHFHNPASHVPRSLMPVFPFDDTKFFALTHMLDVLGVQNRNAIRQIWDQRGFDPVEAFNMLCAQCHGVSLLGNGVIAEWIYPIPKNLHNPEFLRNLTKDRAIYSIRHGVKGTPMPPWGENASDKSGDIQKMSHHIPVLKEAEIRYLVDWIFTSLSGGEVIRKSTDVPKWQYTPEDVIKELEREGGHLIPLTPTQENGQGIKQQQPPERELPPQNNPSPTVDKSLSSLLTIDEIYYASLQPVIYAKNASNEDEKKVEDLFDIVPTPTEDEKLSYYIKKKFYTPSNIEQGQNFFLLNCAVCHGNEADGSGTRSQAMQEAKPRMLTNLDWINSHDDLRLLRSIKYGVPGTAMTPWGDLTNSLQRLQLVIFIRSLTEEQEQRSLLFQALYQAFEMAQLTVEDARIDGSKQMEQLQREAEQLHNKQEHLERSITDGKEKLQEALPTYQKSLEVERKIKTLQERDQQLLDLKTKLKSERDFYYNIGINLMSKDLPESVMQRYYDLIRLNANRYALQDHQLIIHHDAKVDDQIRSARQEIVNELDKKMTVLASIQPRSTANQADLEGYKKIKAKLITDTEEAMRLANEQAKIVKQMETEAK
jgi:mono/diheme cytochrome c family protein